LCISSPPGKSCLFYLGLSRMPILTIFLHIWEEYHLKIGMAYLAGPNNLKFALLAQHRQAVVGSNCLAVVNFPCCNHLGNFRKGDFLHGHKFIRI